MHIFHHYSSFAIRTMQQFIIKQLNSTCKICWLLKSNSNSCNEYFISQFTISYSTRRPYTTMISWFWPFFLMDQNLCSQSTCGFSSETLHSVEVHVVRARNDLNVPILPITKRSHGQKIYNLYLLLFHFVQFVRAYQSTSWLTFLIMTTFST